MRVSRSFAIRGTKAYTKRLLAVQFYLVFFKPFAECSLFPTLFGVVPFFQQASPLQQSFVAGIRPAATEHLPNTLIIVREVFFDELKDQIPPEVKNILVWDFNALESVKVILILYFVDPASRGTFVQNVRNSPKNGRS